MKQVTTNQQVTYLKVSTRRNDMNHNKRATYLSDPSQEALRRSLDIICGKWRLFIIFQLNGQNRRYSELRRLIPDVSEKVLVQELKALVTLGVLKKVVYREVPPRVEYGLTERTVQVLPLLLQLGQIGETFLRP